MKRTGFKQLVLVRPPRSKPVALTLRQTLRQTLDRADKLVSPRTKEHAVRSEPYRRMVAELPCMRCGLEGSSQAAHPPPSGKGIKEDDRDCIPLCCTRLLVPGCHVDLDQFRLMPKQQAIRWVLSMAYFVRRTIVANGDWPKNLPMKEDDEQSPG